MLTEYDGVSLDGSATRSLSCSGNSLLALGANHRRTSDSPSRLNRCSQSEQSKCAFMCFGFWPDCNRVANWMPFLPGACKALDIRWLSFEANFVAGTACIAPSRVQGSSSRCWSIIAVTNLKIPPMICCSLPIFSIPELPSIRGP